MRQFLTGCFLACSVMVSAAAQADDDIRIQSPWIREAPPGMTMLAGYMVVHNDGDQARTLVGARSPVFKRIELHRTVVERNQARMVQQSQIEIPAHGQHAFEPGGYHLMLMHPERPLKAGDRVALVLEFADGQTHEVDATVKKATGMQQQHGH